MIFDILSSIYSDAGLPTTGSGDVMKNLKNLSFVIAAILALYFLVTAGYQYVTSGGNAEKTKKAGQTILYASVGLILVILIYSLITWVFKIGNSGV